MCVGGFIAIGGYGKKETIYQPTCASKIIRNKEQTQLYYYCCGLRSVYEYCMFEYKIL